MKSIQLYFHNNQSLYYANITFSLNQQLLFPKIFLKKKPSFNHTSSFIHMQTAPSRNFQKQFILKGQIGHGTFGQVRKCLWIKNDVVCAVKSIDNVNGMNIEKIQEQASIMKSAQSDFSLELYDHFLDENNSQYFFVMPFCKHGSLEKKMNNDWNLDQTLLFLYQITQAFVDFSQKEITHLDLKPENILIKAPGEYLVCDFGCSKVISDLAISKNWLKMSINKGLGTPEYAPPEILQSNKANKYSDVWSLGIILYKMIYHKHPFSKAKTGLSFGAYQTTFQGHKKQLDPVVNILKRMISVQKRPSWREIRTVVYAILGIGDMIDIVTSTADYREYVKNLSVLGTCLIHHIDRIKDILQASKVLYKPMLKTFLYFLLKLTSPQINSDMFFFFQYTKNNIKNDFKSHIAQINEQILKLIQEKGFAQPSLNGSLSELKKTLVNDTKVFAQGIRKLPDDIRKNLQMTPEFEFFKIKKIVEHVSTQFGKNLTYNRKRQLAQVVRFLVYA